MESTVPLKITVGTFCGVAVLFVAVGLAVQDWDWEQGCAKRLGPPQDWNPEQDLDWEVACQTGGKYDATWGTIVTDYALALEDLVFAILAPGDGLTKWSIAVAFLLDGVAWLGGGIMHQFFYTSSATHDALWITALITGSLAGICRVFAAAIAAKAVGKCQCLPSPAVLGSITGVFGVFVTLHISLALAGLIPVPDWIIVAVAQVLMNLALVCAGYSLGQPVWTSCVLGAFILYVVINQLKPSPFKYSTDFNDNGLFHSAMMVFLACTFGLYSSIVQSGKGEVDASIEGDSLLQRTPP
jgi:hypothetical protein